METAAGLEPAAIPILVRAVLHRIRCHNGAGERNRTPNLLITSQLLYLLSYTSVMPTQPLRTVGKSSYRILVYFLRPRPYFNGCFPWAFAPAKSILTGRLAKYRPLRILVANVGSPPSPSIHLSWYFTATFTADNSLAGCSSLHTISAPGCRAGPRFSHN